MKAVAILVIDDTPLNGVLLKTFLENMGHEVMVVQDGNAGLALLEKRPFDLILLDWLMPAPDGAAILKMLKHSPAWAAIPVLLISSDEVIDGLTPAQEAQLAGYIPKPFARQIVAEQIAAALGS